jgi:IS5 family transposase
MRFLGLGLGAWSWGSCARCQDGVALSRRTGAGVGGQGGGAGQPVRPLPGRRLQSNLPRGGHLNRQGDIARGGQILDASIVPVPRNHNTRGENAAIKKGEGPEDWADKPAKQVPKDVAARWTKNHGKSHYGYKNHVNVDRKHKLVRRDHVSDAALHDSQAVDHLLMQGNTGSSVWADAAP